MVRLYWTVTVVKYLYKKEGGMIHVSVFWVLGITVHSGTDLTEDGIWQTDFERAAAFPDCCPGWLWAQQQPLLW